MSFYSWRRIHRTSSFAVAFVSLVHIGVTFMMYDEWSPDAVWFLGTGVGLLLRRAGSGIGAALGSVGFAVELGLGLASREGGKGGREPAKNG